VSDPGLPTGISPQSRPGRDETNIALGLVYFSGIFIPKRYGDMWGFDVHPILSNPLEYSSPKILYHDREFSI
jgi:hypothetical protein